MYRRPKFLEILHEIREEMSREADYDMDLFAEIVRSGKTTPQSRKFSIDSQPPGIVDLDADHRHLDTDH